MSATLGGRVRDVINRLAAGAGAAAGDARDDLFDRQFVIEHGRQSDGFLLSSNFFQRFRLGDGAGKSVQQKAAGAIQAAQPVAE